MAIITLMKLVEPLATFTGSSSSRGMLKARANDVHQKTKGSVRAKSGCYTCRIRRKKCDEKPDAEGNCQTCVRLRLQCLGFGAKRPEWMRGNNVVEVREKIKRFLVSQGVVRGQTDQSSSGFDADNEDVPGGPSPSMFTFVEPPHPFGVVALATTSTLEPTISSVPSNKGVLVLSPSHRSVPSPKGWLGAPSPLLENDYMDPHSQS